VSWRALIESCSLLLPAWWVWNPGQGGGGGGTVHTDGVTIQGDGSVATPVALLDAITDGSTLQGAGIAANKLRIAPIDFLTQGNPADFISLASSDLAAYGIVVDAPLTFSSIGLIVARQDPSETVDFGLYDLAGDLVCNVGGVVVTSNGLQSFDTLQGSITIPQGRYLFCVNSSGDNFALYGSSNDGVIAWYLNVFFESAVTPGVLPATVTIPAISLTQNNFALSLQ
jgi:hypothetical protein